MADFRFIFRKLAFTGAAKATCELDFVDGVNVIYGASNSGKSYTIKALDFMCGAGSVLPEITELRGYETCWLEQDLPMTERVILSRAVRGGDFEAFIGPFDRVRHTQPARTFSATHSNPNSLSRFLLGELGIADDKQIASTLNGKKASFSFRHFAAYMFTEETPMMAEWSPIKIAPQSSDTYDKNVLKFILTGIDDASIVETPNPNEQRVANAGKIEIVEELIEAAVADLHRLFPEDEAVDKLQVAAQEAALSDGLEEQHARLAEYQTELDRLRRATARLLGNA